MKKFTILMGLFLATVITGQAYASVFCMTSDASVYIDGQEDMFESSSTKSKGVNAGMFDLVFDDPKYTIIKDNNWQWVGTYDKGDSDYSTSVISTMDWATMTYTKVLMSYTAQDGGHTSHIMIVNKCKGER